MKMPNAHSAPRGRPTLRAADGIGMTMWKMATGQKPLPSTAPPAPAPTSAPAPAPTAPATTPVLSQYGGNGVAAQMKAAGLRDGGMLRLDDGGAPAPALPIPAPPAAAPLTATQQAMTGQAGFASGGLQKAQTYASLPGGSFTPMQIPMKNGGSLRMEDGGQKWGYNGLEGMPADDDSTPIADALARFQKSIQAQPFTDAEMHQGMYPSRGSRSILGPVVQQAAGPGSVSPAAAPAQPAGPASPAQIPHDNNTYTGNPAALPLDPKANTLRTDLMDPTVAGKAAPHPIYNTGNYYGDVAGVSTGPGREINGTPGHPNAATMATMDHLTQPHSVWGIPSAGIAPGGAFPTTTPAPQPWNGSSGSSTGNFTGPVSTLPKAPTMPAAPSAVPTPPAQQPNVGLRNGGEPVMQDGQSGTVPGTGSGDKIPAKYEPGEFVVSNAMLDRAPQLRGQLDSLRNQTLRAEGKDPAEVDAKQTAMVQGTGLRAAWGGQFFSNLGGNLKNLVTNAPVVAPAAGGAGTPPVVPPVAPAAPATPPTPPTPNTGTLAPNSLLYPGANPTGPGVPTPVSNAAFAAGQKYGPMLEKGTKALGVGSAIYNGINAVNDAQDGNNAGALDHGLSAAASVAGTYPMLTAAGAGGLGAAGFGYGIGHAIGTYGINPLLSDDTKDAIGSGVNNVVRSVGGALGQNWGVDDTALKSLRAGAAPAPASNAPSSSAPAPADGTLPSGQPFGPQTIPGFSKEQNDSILNNPNGTRWSEGDNAIMAANIRDGVDPYRGTSRSQPDNSVNGQLMANISQLGPQGQAAALANMQRDATLRRSQDMEYERAMMPIRQTMMLRQLGGQIYNAAGGDHSKAAQIAGSMGLLDMEKSFSDRAKEQQETSLAASKGQQDNLAAIQKHFESTLPQIMGPDGKKMMPDTQRAASYAGAWQGKLGTDRDALVKAVAAGTPGAQNALTEFDTKQSGAYSPGQLDAFSKGQQLKELATKYGTGRYNPIGGTDVATDATPTSLTDNQNGIFGFGHTYTDNQGRVYPARAIDTRDGNFLGGVRQSEFDQFKVPPALPKTLRN